MMPVDRLYDRVPIGKPLRNYKCYVVDENLRRLPPLIPGELLIAGRGVGRGYLNRPDLTKKAFIPNPFCDEPDYALAYRTGDVVRLLPDGNIDFIGRNDSQVKVRGFRIELTEIEGVIRSFSGIRDATVQAFEHPDTGEKFIAAYVVSDTELDVSALNQFIAAQKPAYMVPAVTMQIPAIPLNQNQKVDKKALPEPVMPKSDILPPQNEVQQRIFDCVAEVIGSENFGVTTSIYDAGLSSIGAIRLNALLSKAFDVPVSIRDLQEHPTIVGLEEFLGGPVRLEDRPVQADYPLTRTQQAVLAETLRYPDTTIYNIPLLLKLSEGVDPARLKEAVQQAIEAHPYLIGTIFTDEHGQYRISRHDSAAAEVELVHLAQLPQELVKPFDIVGGRLYRARIIMTGSGNYLFLDCHHIVFDGTSAVILLQDINAAYAGTLSAGKEYLGYEIALDEEEQRDTDAYEKSRSYYEALLSDVELDMLPKGDVSEKQSRSGYLKLSSGLNHHAVQAWCRKYRVTENAFYNAVFAFVLMRYNFLDEALYTTIYHGRKDSRMQRAVTMLVKTLPVVCRVSENDRVSDLIRAVKDQLMDSMAADLFSFADISQAFHVTSDIMFDYQGDCFIFDTLGGKPAQMQPLATNKAKGMLDITVVVRDNTVIFECEYYADRYSADFMRGFVAAMEQTAGEFTRKEYLKDVSILDSAAEKCLAALNDNDVDIPLCACHQLFEIQTAIHPDRPAVIAAGTALTYLELNERANRIANALIARGVRLNETVGMLLPRSVDAVAAEYGIMKAGGAFLPMLPDYPDERIDYCMTDSGSRYVLTTEKIIRERGTLFDGKSFTPLPVSCLIAEGDCQNPDVEIPADALASTMFQPERPRFPLRRFHLIFRSWRSI